MTAVRKAGSADLGGRAVVVGLGLVGFFAAQLLRLSGMEVLGVEATAVRRDAAAAAGLRVGATDPAAAVRTHRDERMDGPDLVIEATGSDAGLRIALNLVRDGGEVVLLGTPRGRSASDPVNLMSAIHYRGPTPCSSTGAGYSAFPSMRAPLSLSFRMSAGR